MSEPLPRTHSGRRLGLSNSLIIPVIASSAGLLMAIIPFWAAIIPPMTDVVQHVLVARIVRDFGDPGLAFPTYFTKSWSGAPTDLFYLLLASIQGLVGPFTDAKVYLTTWVFALWGSVFYLARAFMSAGAWLAALFMLPLAFSWYVYMGFLPFIMSIPLFAFSLGVWFRPVEWRWKVPALWLLLIVLFGFHIVGAAAAGAVIATSAGIDALAGTRNGRRNLIFAALCLLPLPLLLLRYLTGANAPAVQAAEFDLLRNILGLLRFTAASLARPVLYLMLAWMAALVSITIVNLRSRRIPTVLLISAFILSLLGVIMPASLGALWPAGPRLLPFALLLMAAGATMDKRWRPAAAAGMAMLLLCLSALTTLKVRQLDPQFREFLSGTEHIALGAKVLPILVDPHEGSQDIDPVWSLASSFTILRVGANPHVFAQPYITTGASPIRYRDHKSFSYAYLFDPTKTAEDYRGVSCCYDYVILWGRDAKLEDVLHDELQLVHEAGRLRVYQSHLAK